MLWRIETVGAIVFFLIACTTQTEERFSDKATAAKISSSEAQQMARAALEPAEVDQTVVSAVPTFSPGFEKYVVQTVIDDGQVVRGFVVDALGVRMPTEEFWRADARVRRERKGALSDELFAQRDALVAEDASIVVDIMIRSDLPEPQLPRGPTDANTTVEDFERWTVQHAASQGRRLALQKASLLVRLSEQGARVINNPSGLPVITAEVSAKVLTRVLASDDEISWISEPANGNERLLSDHAGHQSMNYFLPNGYLASAACSGSCNGNLMTAGIWESEPSPAIGNVVGGIARNNSRLTATTPGSIYYEVNPTPCLDDATCNFTASVNSTNPPNAHVCALTVDSPQKICVQFHTTTVAASIGMNGSYSYDTTNPSNAPDPLPNATGTFGPSGAYAVRYCVANGGSSLNSLNFLVAPVSGPPAVYVNRSVSGAPPLTDWAGRHYGTFVTLAGGNEGTSVNVTCGTLRNILCVGWYEYNVYNSIPTHRVEAHSNSVNPAAMPDLERPHLLGPGTHTAGSGLHMPDIAAVYPGSPLMWGMGVYHPIAAPVQRIAGSSFAAPAVMGLAIQAHQYKGYFSALAFPMVNKAVLLASGDETLGVGGAAKDGRLGKSDSAWFPQPSDAIDGFGQINAAYTKQILDNNQFFTTDLTDASFVACGTGCREFTVATVSVPAFQKLRAVLAWQSCITSAAGNPAMNNDLDLRVSRSGSILLGCTQATTSASVSGEVEAVETGNCPANLTFTIKIRLKNGATLQSCSPSDSFERVGVAWRMLSP